MKQLVDLLKNSITNKMCLDEIVNVFEQMCSIPLKNDMVLFETGTFSFTDEPLFQISLVRQFPNDDEEYRQIHVDILYKPSSENKELKEATWNDGIDESIFNYIRESKAYAYAKNHEYLNVEIYMDET